MLLQMLLFKSEEFKIMGKTCNYHDLEKLTVTLLAFKFLKKARFLSISVQWIAKSGSRRSYTYFYAFLSCISFLPYQPKKVNPHYLIQWRSQEFIPEKQAKHNKILKVLKK